MVLSGHDVKMTPYERCRRNAHQLPTGTPIPGGTMCDRVRKPTCASWSICSLSRLSAQEQTSSFYNTLKGSHYARDALYCTQLSHQMVHWQSPGRCLGWGYEESQEQQEQWTPSDELRPGLRNRCQLLAFHHAPPCMQIPRGSVTALLSKEPHHKLLNSIWRDSSLRVCQTLRQCFCRPLVAGVSDVMRIWALPRTCTSVNPISGLS